MLTTELCARLCADFPLQLPDAPACFACTRVVLDPWDDAEGGTVFIGEGTVDRPDRFYLLCAPGAPQHPNAAHYADPALTLPLVRAVHRLLEPERRPQRRLHRLDHACPSGGLQDLLAAARQELGNPVLVVDSSFRTLAMEPEQPIGIDSWDRILQGEAPQHHDLKQAEAMIENFSARNLTGLQTVPYTEPDGRPVRRMVGPVVAPDDGRNCGGLEIIELEHPFAPEDEVLAQRLLELLQHYLVHAAPTAWRAAPEERFLQELLFCEPAQQSAMQKKLHRFPALEAPPHFYLASIPLSQAHRLTRTNQQALLAHEWPEGWFMQTETAFLLLLPGTGDAAQPEQLLQKLQVVGLRMDQTVILSMPFPSLLQLGTVWRFNQEAAATARDLHCGAGCRSASALYQDVFVRTIAQSANLRAFIHPMLRRLQEYDQAHSTALLHTLCVYLLQEQNLHATARQLFIHRNTLVYRLQRIRTLLQLDLDDAAVRNVLRTGCILLEYYQGAF